MNDHDLLVRIDENVKGLHALMESHQATDNTLHGDMESRLRSLEATKQSQKGAITVLCTVISAFWALVLAGCEAFWSHRHG